MPLEASMSETVPAYIARLNPAQREAVTSVDGAYLVVAGAGSGKTLVLVSRVAHLVAQGVDPRAILLLTFTNRAAREMLRRASALLDERCGRVAGGTFHAFANNVLRRHASLLGYGNSFSILDRSDSEDLIHRIRTHLGLSSKERRFPVKRTLMSIISSAANTGRGLVEVVNEDYPHFFKELVDIAKVAEAYDQAKRRRSLMDFDDLLLNLRQLLRDHPQVSQKLSRTYRYVMVDEYQDTNRIQAEIAARLAVHHGNLMVVGDDSQSIYAFRGARYRNILEFPDMFEDCRVIKLERNYRSTQPILDLTNAVIANAPEVLRKRLYTDVQDPQKPVYLRPDDEIQQAMFICRRVLDLREEGVPLPDIAVLARALYHAAEVQIELGRHNIPYVVYGGRRFNEAAHIKDALAYLRVIQNAEDELAWQRGLELIEGIGPVTASRLIEAITAAGGDYDALVAEPFQGKRYSDWLARLHEVIQRSLADGISVAQQIEEVLAYYQPILERQYDDHPRRQPDLDVLRSVAARYGSLEEFLTDLTLEPHQAEERVDEASHGDEDPMVVSTIHSAKGLEWHTVFVVHVVDGSLPSDRSLGSQEEIEEERRLLYVAATRAKRQLYLLAPITRGSGRPWFLRQDGGPFAKPSRFLEEIADLGDLVDEWALLPGHGGEIRAYGPPEELPTPATDDDATARQRRVDDFFGL